jgi:hypothetical protein
MNKRERQGSVCWKGRALMKSTSVQNRRSWITASVPLAFLLWAGGMQVKCAQPVMEQVVIDWQHRQQRVRNIRYVLRGEALVPKGKVGEVLMQKRTVPEEDTKYEKKILLLLDFDSDRMRREVNGQTFDMQKGGLVPYERTELFDGSLSKVFMPRNPQNPPELDADLYLIGRDQQGGVHFELGEFPIFLAHGIVPTELKDTLVGSMTTPKHLLLPLKQGAFTIHGRGLRAARECLVLRTQGDPQTRIVYEYWIDLARESAIVQMNSYINGMMDYTIEIDYQETPHGWLPISWVKRQNTDKDPNGVGIQSPAWIEQDCSYRVVELLANQDLQRDDFEIELKPGLIVRDTHHDVYRVGNDGKTLIAITGKKGSIWQWLRYILAATLTLMLLWYLFRRYYRRQRV